MTTKRPPVASAARDYHQPIIQVSTSVSSRSAHSYAHVGHVSRVWNARRKVRKWVREPTKVGAMTLQKWRLAEQQDAPDTEEEPAAQGPQVFYSLSDKVGARRRAAVPVTGHQSATQLALLEAARNNHAAALAAAAATTAGATGGAASAQPASSDQAAKKQKTETGATVTSDGTAVKQEPSVKLEGASAIVAGSNATLSAPSAPASAAVSPAPAASSASSPLPMKMDTDAECAAAAAPEEAEESAEAEAAEDDAAEAEESSSSSSSSESESEESAADEEEDNEAEAGGADGDAADGTDAAPKAPSPAIIDRSESPSAQEPDDSLPAMPSQQHGGAASAAGEQDPSAEAVATDSEQGAPTAFETEAAEGLEGVEQQPPAPEIDNSIEQQQEQPQDQDQQMSME